MFYAEILGAATLLGFLVGLITAVWLYNRLVGRLKAKGSVLQTAIELENRRLAHDYGRETEVRENAGPQLRISNLAVTRPGTMTLHHMKG